MNQRFFLFCLLLFTNSLSAQRLVRVNSSTPVCAAEGDEVPTDRRVYVASQEAQKTIDDICRKIGVSPKGFIIEAANVKNAEALILGGNRYIHYNPLYINRIKLQSQTDWALTYVLSHEIGHHINYHTLDTINTEKRQFEELDADKFAGCALRHMGASIEELEKAMSILSAKGDKNHPPRQERQVAILRGWEDCMSNNISDSPTPPIKDKDCASKKTNDIYFKNTTNRPIRVHKSIQTGWYEMGYITVDPGETKGILDLNIGKQSFVIRISSKNGFGGNSFEDYKNEQVRVDPCADKSQSTIIVK